MAKIQKEDGNQKHVFLLLLSWWCFMGWIHSFGLGSEHARWIWQTVNALLLCIEYQVTSTLIPTTLPRILCFSLNGIPWPLFSVLMCDLWTLLYSLNEGHRRGPQFWGNYSDDERIAHLPTNCFLTFLLLFIYWLCFQLLTF